MLNKVDLQKQVFEEITKNKKNRYRIYMTVGKESILPPNLVAIQREWTKLSNESNDEGSCVLGAGFIFYYEDTIYKKQNHS